MRTFALLALCTLTACSSDPDKNSDAATTTDVAADVVPSDIPRVDTGATDVPVADAPVTDAGTVDVPAVDAPAVDVPAVDVPALDVPAGDAQTADVVATDGTSDGGGSCGGLSCGSTELCVRTLVIGGALITPDDAGGCPSGWIPDTDAGRPCRRPYSWACVARPTACATLACGCVGSLCVTCESAVGSEVHCVTPVP